MAPGLTRPSPFQSPITGLQPTPPYWKGGVYGYQVMEPGSTTRGVLCAPANQAADTGSQPGSPNGFTPASGAPALSSLRRYQVAVDGSNTPMPVFFRKMSKGPPRTAQWPTTGTQPGAPYWKTPASGGPALSSLRRYQ